MSITTNTEQLRAGFEKWATDGPHPEGGYRLEKTISGEYINAETRTAFRGWAASKRDGCMTAPYEAKLAPQVVPTEINAVIQMGFAYLDAARSVDPNQNWSFSHAGWKALLEEGSKILESGKDNPDKCAENPSIEHATAETLSKKTATQALNTLGIEITPDELTAFHRFCECSEDFDSGGYDVDKTMMVQLSRIGLVRSTGFGRYETTVFGDFVREQGYPGNQELERPVLELDSRLRKELPGTLTIDSKQLRLASVRLASNIKSGSHDLYREGVAHGIGSFYAEVCKLASASIKNRE